MKKLIILILVIALLILSGVIMFNGISIGNLKIESIHDIRIKSAKLDKDLATCVNLTNMSYPEAVNKLEEAIKNLKKNKDKYEMIKPNDTEESALNTTQIKVYNSDFLWKSLGIYAKKHGIDLTIELTQGTTSNSYNINFIALGDYIGVTDFIYELENDTDLSFKIEKFAMEPNSNTTTTKNTNSSSNQEKTTNTTNTTNKNTVSNSIIQNNKTNTNTTNNTTSTTTNIPKTSTDTSVLKATFTVSDIEIDLN